MAETVELKKNEHGLIVKTLSISKKDKENGKYIEQGKIDIYIPPLALLGVEAEEGEPEDSLPTYKDIKAQYLFDAVVAAVKSKTRNCLQPSTATLKEGSKIPETLEEVMERGGPGGGPEALAAIRELKKAFAFWVASLKKTQKTSDQIIGYFNNREALSLMTDEVKKKMQGYVAAFMEASTTETLERGQKYLSSVLEAAEIKEATEEVLDF